MAYADLEVLIQRWSAGGYAVDMRFHTADGQADAELALNVPIQIDHTTLLEQFNDPDAYGRTLTAMIFSDQRLVGAFLRVRGFIEGANLSMRLRIRLDPDAPELHAVRWESLFDPDRNAPIGRSERIVLSRYLDSGSLGRIVVPARNEMQALVAVASPRDLAKFKLQPFDGVTEAERVRKALGDIPTATMVSGDGGPTVSMNAICDALRFGYSILYLVCHGVLREGQPMLCLESDDGGALWVAGDTLAERIADLSQGLRPLLVVLASCQSVGVGQGSAVPAALGPKLARAGVGAVVGMQGDVPMDLVARLMPRFFDELAESGEIDRALAVGRAGLAADSPWWMPVLFLRLRDGRLWQAPAAAPEISPPPAIAPTRPPHLLWVGGAAAIIVVLLIAAFSVVASRSRVTSTTATDQAQQITSVALSTQRALLIDAGVSPDNTAVAAAAPTGPPVPTSTPMPTSIPTVVPVASGKYMILVSDLEPAAQTNRDYARDIYDDLQRNLEQLPFSDMQIRRYRGIVKSEAEATSAATNAGAAVVIWGRYDESRIDLQVQVGDRSQFPGIPKAINDGTLARTGNLSLQIPTTGEIKSAALSALTTLMALKTAEGDSFAILRQTAIQDQLLRSLQVADIQGQSSATWGYRFILNFYSNPEESLAATRAGLSNDPGNPILLIYRAATYLRLRKPVDAAEDLNGAARAAPGWAVIETSTAAVRFQLGDLAGSAAAFDRALELRRNDWFSYSYRGGLKYLLGDLAGARADEERAIEIGPITSQPYAFAAIIALREGRLDDAKQLIGKVHDRFSGTAGFDTVFYSSMFGSDNPVSLTSGVFDQIVAGQYGEAIGITDKGLALAGSGTPVPPVVPGDLLFMRGFAQCNRGDDAGAVESYTKALEFSPDFALLHLLRADVRSRLGDATGAQEDLGVAAANEQLKPIVDGIMSGQITLTCKTLLN